MKELPLELKDIHKNLVDTLNEKYTQWTKKDSPLSAKKQYFEAKEQLTKWKKIQTERGYRI